MMHACGVVLGGYSLPSERNVERKTDRGREREYGREVRVEERKDERYGKKHDHVNTSHIDQ